VDVARVAAEGVVDVVQEVLVAVKLALDRVEVVKTLWLVN
jgi:hypothetical protein